MIAYEIFERNISRTRKKALKSIISNMNLTKTQKIVMILTLLQHKQIICSESLLYFTLICELNQILKSLLNSAFICELKQILKSAKKAFKIILSKVLTVCL